MLIYVFAKIQIMQKKFPQIYQNEEVKQIKNPNKKSISLFLDFLKSY